MGSGKTTTAEQIAQKSGRKFIDIDKEIVKKEQKSINRIFREKGEEYFRDLETEALKSLDPSKYLIIATGGGTPIRKINREIMKDKGYIIYLYATPETLARRLEGDKQRPLLKGEPILKKLTNLLDERGEFYKDYNFKVDVNELTPLQAAKEIIQITKKEN